MKNVLKKILFSRPIAPVCKVLYDFFTMSQYRFLCLKWRVSGHGKPSAGEAKAVSENVTFIFKSFQRQNMAKRLYRSIQSYYPGARVIIADDSEKPLRLEDSPLTVVRLPFNSGLSFGLNRALKKVETPFTMRLDDDTLLTPFSNIHGQLRFLKEHPEVDLIAVQPLTAPKLTPVKITAKSYLRFDMRNAPKKLIIPHRTKLDDNRYVMGKVPNLFLARTDKFKSVGYDDNIRMIDHNEFFVRAAGNIVSAMDVSAFVFHYHNPFDMKYKPYREDYKRDLIYIRMKYSVNKKPTE